MFAERLSTLLDVYRMSNVTLARGIGVDPSLVSRWKSGERAPTSGGGVYGDLAHFLAGAPLRGHDKVLLTQLIRAGGEEDFLPALERYLRQGAPASPGGSAEALPPILSLESLMDRVCGGVAPPPGRPRPPGRRPEEWKNLENSGRRQEHELYHGLGGRRQAAVNFFRAVLASGRPADVHILVPSDAQWLSEDSPFSKLWFQCLEALTLQGCHVRMVHPAPVSPAALLSLLTRHLPLYATGRFFSLCAAEPPVGWESLTLCVAPGLAAMVSYGGGRQRGSVPTALYRDAADVLMYETMLRLYEPHMRALAHACPAAEPLSYMRALVELENKPGDYVFAAVFPGTLWLPEALWPPVVRRLPSSGAAAAALRLLAGRRENFEVRVASSLWIEMWAESFLRTLEREKRLELDGRELGSAPKLAVLEGEELVRYLGNALTVLRWYDNLHVLTSDALSDSWKVAFKRDAGALLAPAASGVVSAFFLGDRNTMHMLENWRRSLRRGAGDKADLIARIEGILKALAC
ncbi:MAG: hypothetical protein LBF64_01755 [Oscillospiraceae bacterium]|nr:hypothetical protein [Oscillospiraceae bacterium]